MQPLPLIGQIKLSFMGNLQNLQYIHFDSEAGRRRLQLVAVITQ